jgi:hypothetical protein
MKIEVSVGEAIDKLSILELKNIKINDVNKKQEIEKEIKVLNECLIYTNKYPILYKLLIYVNEYIWDLTDSIKKMSIEDNNFSYISNQIFEFNQKRFRIKNLFSLISESSLKEQKSYSLLNCNILVKDIDRFKEKILNIYLLSLDYDSITIISNFNNEIRELINIPTINYIDIFLDNENKIDIIFDDYVSEQNFAKNFNIKDDKIEKICNEPEKTSDQIQKLSDKNNNLWIWYAFDYHNYNVLEDYINSLKEIYNIVYTKDIGYVLSCNPKKISYIMYINDDTILDKYKNSDVELSFLNTEPLSISYNLTLLKNYINKYPFLKIYDYSFSNLEIIFNNNMYGEILEYNLYEKEKKILNNLLLTEPKIYDFGIITYGNTKTNNINSLFHKKKEVVNHLINKGFKIHIISGWGFERDIELAKCKVILNIHSILENNGKTFYSKTFENIRCNRLLDAGYKILSEDIIHCNQVINKYKNNLKFINYDNFKNIEYSENFWDKIEINKIKKYCFIHSCTLENVGVYRLNYLIYKLYTSGCISIFDKIYINNIGLPVENIYGEKFEVINFSDNTQLFETPTINLIQNFSEKNPNSYILYLHTKGIRYFFDSQLINDWIDYMLYFLVEEYKNCITILDNNYDVIGCNYSDDMDKESWKYTKPYPPPHYSGNFWWANTNYLKRLNILPLDSIERNKPEFWLFTNNPIFYNLHSSNINHYHSLYPRNNYSNN